MGARGGGRGDAHKGGRRRDHCLVNLAREGWEGWEGIVGGAGTKDVVRLSPETGGGGDDGEEVVEALVEEVGHGCDECDVTVTPGDPMQ